MASATAMNRVARITAQLAPNNVVATFDNVKLAPPNAIFNTKTMYKNSKNPKKVSLGIGAYRDDNGKPYVLKAVIEAERRIVEQIAEGKLNHEYLGQNGDPEYCKAASQLLYGADSPAIRDGRIAVSQSVSGTGALKLAAEFIHRFFPKSMTYISKPTWGNHGGVWRDAYTAGTKPYRYWDPKTRGLDIDGMLADLNAAPANSIVMLHACAHNPTGVDPTQEQWVRIGQVMKAKNLIPLFDSAYQGFASGDLEKDAWAIRHFVATGHTLLACQSFAKNFGLYGERTGTFSVVCPDAATAKAVNSQVALYVRTMYSNPPTHGSRIVKTVLNDPELYALWDKELKMMSNRINDMRIALYSELKKLGTPGDWTHITSQIGMFSFTGLTKKQCAKMKGTYDVYLLDNGRISMAGINTKNVAYVAEAIDNCFRTA